MRNKDFLGKIRTKIKIICINWPALKRRCLKKFFREKENNIGEKLGSSKKKEKSIREGINEGKNLWFLFLIGLRDNSLFKIKIAKMYPVMYFMYISHLYINYICLYKREMNDSNDIIDGRKELGLLYYVVLTPPVKWYSVFWIWTCISCKCILQNPGKPLNTNNNMKEEEEWEEEEEKYNQYAKKGEKWETQKMLN